MNWLFGDKTKKLTGSYPHGQKFFRCSFTREQIEAEKMLCSEKATSGQIYWRLFTQKENQDGLYVSLRCDSEKNDEKKEEKKWKVEAEHTIRVLNSADLSKSIILHKTLEFDSENKSQGYHVKFPSPIDDFFDDDCMTFEVEIGVKSINFPEQTAVKTPNGTDVTLLIDDEKFIVNTKTLSDVSTVFSTLFEGIGDSEEAKKDDATTVPINNTNSAAFRMLLNIIQGDPVKIDGEHVEELLKLGERFKVSAVSKECAQFLKTSVVDDAEAVRLADKYKLEDVIVQKLESLNTLFDLKTAFKSYRYFSESTMKLLLKKLLTVKS